MTLSDGVRSIISVILAVAALVVLWIAFSRVPRRAQDERPAVREAASGPKRRLSPHETAETVTRVGRITIEYGRPYKRGRQIWGGLVPWKQWWMPGADEATVLRVDHQIWISDLSVPPGEYTLYMWVDPDAPKLIVNRQVGQWHNSYDSTQDLGRVGLTRTNLETVVEQLTFEIEEHASEGGNLNLLWDRTRFRWDSSND
jgi:hypothetical protein